MKPKTKIFLSLFVASLVSNLNFKTANAQVNPVVDAYVILDSLSPSQVSGTYVISLSDTNYIDSISISLSSSPNDPIGLVYCVIGYDASTGLPNGFSYSRQQSTIRMEIGSLDRSSLYYGIARVKANQTWTIPYNFISQLTF